MQVEDEVTEITNKNYFFECFFLIFECFWYYNKFLNQID